MVQLTQIEVTTRCNYDCKYCAGRSMEQKDMSWEMFLSIAQNITSKQCSLQGEGEPTLWPYFYKAAQYLHSRKIGVSTIINASRVNIELLDAHFTKVGVSIDTLDDKVAQEIGRHKLSKVLDNLQLMIPKLRNRLTIHTTDFGQDLEPIKKYCADTNIKHVIQPLQKKLDYVVVYPKHWDVKINTVRPNNSYSCVYLREPLMEFYTIDGYKRPCCFMKSHTTLSKQQLQLSLKSGSVSQVCVGCFNLKPVI